MTEKLDGLFIEMQEEINNSDDTRNIGPLTALLEQIKKECWSTIGKLSK